MADDLSQEIFSIGFPVWFDQIKDLRSGLEDDALHALFAAKLFNIDAGQFAEVGLAVNDRSQVSNRGRFVGVER